ncbi:MAG TPA: peptidyl-prolyl cis-trans isomerase [Solirubrobacteraceae bacterium]|jgi:hypothetical protein|nr:peptidyl-prolyl cis-trans isomerase [Solirubrobacteraceae bacterium]
MRTLVKASSVTLLAGLVIALSACGQSHKDDPITVRDQSISRAAVTGFAHAIKGGSTFPWLSPELPNDTEQASALLIRYHWLVGEATDEGLTVTAQDTNRALRERASASLGGEAVYRATLGETGETQAQAQLALVAEISAQRLQQKIIRSTPQPTPAEIQAYYQSHTSRFRVPEERIFNLAERIDGPTELASAKDAMNLGHSLSGQSYEAEFNESLSSSLVAKPIESSPDVDRQVVVNAIFSKPIGVVAGPFPYYGKRAIFKVIRIVPAYERPLAKVTAQIAKQLRSEALSKARTKFVEGWRAKWTARTECASGYVVEGCEEYHGRYLPEDDPLSPE